MVDQNVAHTPDDRLLVQELMGFRADLDQNEASGVPILLRMENGETEQTRLNLRAVLGDAAERIKVLAARVVDLEEAPEAIRADRQGDGSPVAWRAWSESGQSWRLYHEDLGPDADLTRWEPLYAAPTPPAPVGLVEAVRPEAIQAALKFADDFMGLAMAYSSAGIEAWRDGTVSEKEHVDARREVEVAKGEHARLEAEFLRWWAPRDGFDGPIRALGATLSAQSGAVDQIVTKIIECIITDVIKPGVPEVRECSEVAEELRRYAPKLVATLSDQTGGGPVAAGETASGWMPISKAPYDQEVEVLAGKMRFRAKLVRDGSTNEDGETCDQWQAAREGEHPPCWSGGSCWERNADLSPSLHPDRWRPLTANAGGHGRSTSAPDAVEG